MPQSGRNSQCSSFVALSQKSMAWNGLRFLPLIMNCPFTRRVTMRRQYAVIALLLTGFVDAIAGDEADVMRFQGFKAAVS